MYLIFQVFTRWWYVQYDLRFMELRSGMVDPSGPANCAWGGGPDQQQRPLHPAPRYAGHSYTLSSHTRQRR